jgi:hypothetical protein
MRSLLTLWLLIYSVKASALITDQGQFSSAWLKLLHYEQISSDHFRSLLKDSNFFLAPFGNLEPQEELKMNLDALKLDPNYPCRFPARALLLSEAYKIPFSHCKAVEEWKRQLSGPAVSIVFIGQYISNPASVFGHTFILFKDPLKPLNLNTTINYAAQMPENIGVFDYVVGGLTGRFPGEFGLDYFYTKLQEYGAIENRDMWVYDLDLDKSQLEQFQNHLWELSQYSKESYAFANKNCSVSIYNALAAVHPDLDFIGGNTLYVLPLNTIQKILSVSKSHSYIPSLREKIRQNYLKLKSDDKIQFENFISNPADNHQKENIEVLEIKLDYFEFLKTKSKGTLSAEDTLAYSSVLIKRSKLGNEIDEPAFTAPKIPHNGSKPWRVGVGYGEYKKNSHLSYIFSPISHHLLQRENGYLANSEVIALETEIQSIEDKFEFDHITLFSLKNFPIRTIFDPQKSWTAKLDIQRNEFCKRCYTGIFEAAIGTSLAFSQHLGYALIGFSNKNDFIFHPEITFGTIMNFENWKAGLEFIHAQPLQDKYDSKDSLRTSINAQLSNLFDLELSYKTYKNSQISSSSDIFLNYFF